MIKHKPKRILICRTDSIGDVMLTLPMAGVLKNLFPDCELLFLGKNYTRNVIECCEHINAFVNWDEMQNNSPSEAIDQISQLNVDVIIHAFPRPEIAQLAKKAQIPHRIGTSGRAYHFRTVNHPVFFSRKRSDLHEAQLNLKLLKPLGWKKELSLDEVSKYYGFTKVPDPSPETKTLLNLNKFNLILHPKSKGSAREWGVNNFNQLIETLPKDRFEIFITGTEDEGNLIRDELLSKHDFIHDLTGKLNLKQLIAFIASADGLVAASTGPLHLAAALGIHAIGIYPPIRPMHPGRWAPLGEKATFIVKNISCSDCRKINTCHCMAEIKTIEVVNLLMKIIDG